MNENSLVRSLGERVAILEAVNAEMRLSLDHLHDCMHEVKKDAIARDKIWDRRYQIGLGLVGGVLLVSGMSLGKILELLSKIHP